MQAKRAALSARCPYLHCRLGIDGAGTAMPVAAFDDIVAGMLLM